MRHPIAVVLPLFLFLSCAPAAGSGVGEGTARAAPAPGAAGPVLIVVITVDQLRPDYFARFGTNLEGGLARLFRNGAVFTDAHQDHALTETAPGHASVLSGRFPRSTRIIANAPGVFDSTAVLVEGEGPGASPVRFRGSAFYDWLRTKYPQARALSVSMKDRGAILPVGRSRQEVYWYSPSGVFTTSTYYRRELPAWVAEFNRRDPVGALAGRTWDLLLPGTAYPEPDSVAAEAAGGADFIFPHTLPQERAAAAQALRGFPWMDSLTFALALEGVNTLGLGAGEHPDLLAISPSATDIIGHRFGPDSREVHDQVLRLDRYLGAFLDSLFAIRDSARVVVVLTADHGVAPFPALAPAADDSEAREVDLSPALERAAAMMSDAGVPGEAFRLWRGIVQIDRSAFQGKALRAEDVLSEFTRAALEIPGVLRVEGMASLESRAREGDDIARRVINSIPPDLALDLVVILSRYSIWGSAPYARHGSPHSYDSHVPLIFYGRWFVPGRYDVFARTVDIAPTLSRIAAVTVTEPVDGRVLGEALSHPER